MIADGDLIDLLEVDAFAGHGPDRVYDLTPAAVVDRDVEDGAATHAGAFVRLTHLVLQGGRQLLEPA